MNGSHYLVDTNVLIYLGNGDRIITEFLQGKNIFISFISEMELLSKPGLSQENIRILQSIVDDCVLVDFNHHIKYDAIKLRRTHRLRLPDAIVAATSLYLHVPLVTADKDFKKVEDIELLYLNI